MSNIKILDCTLRDGGFVNEWNFGHNAIINIYSRLVSSNIDIIELGFLDSSYEFDINRTIMPHTKHLSEIFNIKTENKPLSVAMVILGDCPIENIGQCSDCIADGIRLVFKNTQIDQAFDYAKKLIDKGYIVFLQPASVTDYSDRQMLDLIEKTNELNPYALYIVDTYGLMHKDKVLRYFNLMNNNLNKNIHIGYHSHNNFQLSYATALDIVEIRTDRNVIIDSSLFGMGKNTGNLNTELITDYLNKQYNTGYDVFQILEIIDLEILKIKQLFPWGYSLNGFIAASNDCHPKYVKYLLDKRTISVKSMNIILSRLEAGKKTTFDKQMIEKLYYDFQSIEIDDSKSLEMLKATFKDKEILLLAPGSSLYKQRDEVNEFIEKNKPIVISINHAPDAFNLDYAFISNAKRYSQMVLFVEKNFDTKIIATSNITSASRQIDFSLNYSKLLVEGDINIISDNATLMMFKALSMMGIKKVNIAGFDGFSKNTCDNYVDNYLSYNTNSDNEKQNLLISQAVKKIGEDIDICFITKSCYI